MKSLDKLRDACNGHMYTSVDDIPHLICDAFGIGHRPYSWGSVLLPVCDAVEAEIAERYMELPLDADGAPIKMGDYLSSDEYGGEKFECIGLNVEQIHGHERWSVAKKFNEEAGCVEYTAALRCHHVTERTVEDVLEEFFCIASLPSSDETRNRDEIVCDYADELREMMEVER